MNLANQLLKRIKNVKKVYILRSASRGHQSHIFNPISFGQFIRSFDVSTRTQEGVKKARLGLVEGQTRPTFSLPKIHIFINNIANVCYKIRRIYA